MRLLEDLYVYPWTSYEANNCNTVFIDGKVPTIIDPGHAKFLGHIVSAMARDGKQIDAVRFALGTHSHPDHIEAMDYFDASVVKAIGRTEYEYLREEGEELYFITGDAAPKTPFSVLLKEGSLNLGDKEFIVLETPGHSPGSICLYWQEKKVLISGDTLFYMGVGRTDLPGGNTEALISSIQRLAGLDIEYLVPGHGEVVRGFETIRKNFQAILGGLL